MNKLYSNLIDKLLEDIDRGEVQEVPIKEIARKLGLEYRQAVELAKHGEKSNKWKFVSGRRGKESRVKFIEQPPEQSQKTALNIAKNGRSFDANVENSNQQNQQMVEISITLRLGTNIKFHLPHDVKKEELSIFADAIKNLPVK